MTTTSSGQTQLISQLEYLIAGEDSFISNLANASALLYQQVPGIQWVGFYLWDAERRELILGPFQGLPAVTRIPYGKGVCGAAVLQNTSQLVQHAKDNRCELAIPLHQGKTIIGVLAIDSQAGYRFKPDEQASLELFVNRLIANHVL